jgi:hypothetical protein
MYLQILDKNNKVIYFNTKGKKDTNLKINLEFANTEISVLPPPTSMYM